MNQGNRQYKILHSLNAIRVCAEYCVVHCHVALDGHDFLQNGRLASELMSFFFVLSGFMAMHTNMDTDFSTFEAKTNYIYRRLHKVYPTYLIWMIIDIPGYLMQRWEFTNACPLFWVSIASQPIILHAWMGSWRVGTINTVCWYLCTLFWLWFIFPFINIKHLFAARPWASILCLYSISLLCFTLMSDFHQMDVGQLPIMRLCEFMMGCCVAFTLDKPINGWFVLILLLCFFAYCAATYSQPDLWSIEDVPIQCKFWQQIRHQTITLNPTLLHSMFSFVFCLTIHWLAAKENREEVGISMLEWDFFKSLSTFSLEIYLSHFTVAKILVSTFRQCGILNWWSTDTLILACYLIAYVYSKLVSSIMSYLMFSLSLTLPQS